jgi:phosphoribosylamine--glycine ligase
MGAVSPVPFVNDEFMRKIEDRIIRPTVEGLKKENIPYQGFLYFGLINCKGDPYVIEYNVRMGDPEAEAVVPRISSDILELFEGIATRTLASKKVDIIAESVTTVMLVSGGYPGSYEKGKVIENLDKTDGCIVFHAGTKLSDGKVVTNGGRVISLSAYGKTFREALSHCYRNADIITFDKMYYRTDIGFDL